MAGRSSTEMVIKGKMRATTSEEDARDAAALKIYRTALAELSKDEFVSLFCYVAGWVGQCGLTRSEARQIVEGSYFPAE